MKATRKLIPAIAMLVVSAVVMSTASYAWFTMSRTVSATGMELNVTAPTSLLIAADDGTTTDGATLAYAETVTIAAPAVKLIPASSMTGADDTFYSAKNNIWQADAGAVSNQAEWDDTITGLDMDSAADDEGQYFDYVFWLKSAGSATTVNVNYGTGTSIADKTAETTNLDISGAVRIALLNADGTAPAKNIYAKSFDYFTAKGVVGPMNATPPASSDTKTIITGVADTNQFATGATTVLTATATPTKYILRVWVEGQDKDCVVANAAADFAVNLVLSDTTYTEGLIA